MTEYDYSPQAWERYIATQHRIARWVDGTLVQEPCNAFTPATPHVQALQLKKEEKHRRREERRAHYDQASDLSDEHDSRYARSSHTRHRKSHSTKEASSSHRSPRKDRSRERDRDRKDRDRPRESGSSSARHYRPEKPEKSEKRRHREDADFVWVERESPSPSSSSTRPRSSSQSVTSKPRPSHSSRSYTSPPLTLDLQQFPGRPQDPYYYHHRNSGHSSQSSATTPNSGSTSHGRFPNNQTPPHSAPPLTGAGPVLGGSPPPKAHRSHTMPQYVYANVGKSGYPVGSQPVHLPIRPSMSPSKSHGRHDMTYAPDPSVRSPSPCVVRSVPAHNLFSKKAPQLPYAAYQPPPKSQSLLKRMFGFKAKNESISQPQYHPAQPSKDAKDPSMFLGGGSSVKRMTRKRSVSF